MLRVGPPFSPAWSDTVSGDTRSLLFHLPPQSNWITSEKSTQTPVLQSHFYRPSPGGRGGGGTLRVNFREGESNNCYNSKMQASSVGAWSKNKQTMPTFILNLKTFLTATQCYIVQCKAIQTARQGIDMLGPDFNRCRFSPRQSGQGGMFKWTFIGRFLGWRHAKRNKAAQQRGRCLWKFDSEIKACTMENTTSHSVVWLTSY